MRTRLKRSVFFICAATTLMLLPQKGYADKYAILISASTYPEWFSSSYSELKYAYDTLTDVYGYPEENISILMEGGCVGDTVSFLTETPLSCDLDGDGDIDVSTDAADKANIIALIESMNSMQRDDSLYIHISGGGGGFLVYGGTDTDWSFFKNNGCDASGSATQTTIQNTCLWDQAFGDAINSIEHYAYIIMDLKFCFSGNFIEEAAGRNRVILAATDGDDPLTTTSFGGHFLDGANGHSRYPLPSGTDISTQVDTSPADGNYSVREAYVWAEAKINAEMATAPETLKDHPQYWESVPGLGGALTLGGPIEYDVPPTDIVLVLDRSGSMAAQDFVDDLNNDTRLEVARKGARYFIAALDPNTDNSVGIVSYNQVAGTPLALTNPVTGSAQIETKLDEYATVASGTTSIGAGLTAALGVLPDYTVTQRRQAVLLLTDGRQNTAPCISVNGATGECVPGTLPVVTRDDFKLDPVNDPSKIIPICSLGMARAEANLDQHVLEDFSDQFLDAQPNDQQLATAMASFTKCASFVNGSYIAVDPNGILEKGMVAAPAYTYTSAGDTKLTFLSSWSTTVDKLGDMRLLVNKPNGDLLVPTAPADKSFTSDWHIQRDRLPDVGEWRFQVMRDNTRIVNGFTSDSFDDYDKGVALIRRQIQRMCPDGCDNVLYFEDGRVGSGPSVYAGALDAELDTGLINTVDSYDETTAAAFEAALNASTPLHQLLIYIHQLPGTAVEPYDDELMDRLCYQNTDRRAILTDTRAPLQTEGDPSVSFHICSGAYPGGMDTINFGTLENVDNTMLDEDLAINDQGYSVFSYGVGAIPQESGYMSVIGAAQLEGRNESAASITVPGNIPVELGSIVTMSMDIVFYPGVDCPPETTCDPPPATQRTRSLQRWASEVHFAGFAPIEPVHTPAELNEGITLSVKTDTFSPPGGIQSASVWAEVVRPLIGLDDALNFYGCPGELTPNGDLVYGSGASISPDAIPTATESYWLNDLGVDGDLSAADQVWSLFVPELGELTGTYEIHYYAEFTYTDASGMTRTMHRESIVTQYVGEEVYGGSTPCPSTGNCDPDLMPPVIEAPADLVVTGCDVSDGEITLEVPYAADGCVDPVDVVGEVIDSDSGAVGTLVESDGTVVLPLGTHTIRWTADDGTNQAYVDQVVTVLPGLFAAGKLQIGDRAVVGAAVSVGSLLTTIGNNASTADILSVPGVFAGHDITVDGSITSAGNIWVGANSEISGGIYRFASLSLPDFPSFTGLVIPPAAGDINVYVNDTNTLPLSPGSYHNIYVNSGGTLVLSPGDYYFEGLTVNSDATVTVSPEGPVQIYLQNQFALRSAITDAVENPVAVSVAYLGVNSVVLEAPFLGTFVAPNATLEMGTSNALYFAGEFMAKNLIVRPDVTVECISFGSEPNDEVPSCNDGEQNQDETDVDCGGVCGNTCDDGELCDDDDDCVDNNCVAGVCQTPVAGCTEFTAVDLGVDGNTVTVPNDGCIMVRDHYPSWWGTHTMMLQNTSPGAYPVPFTWKNDCSASAGSGSFTGDWQNKFLNTTSSACATLIDLQGSGTGTISIRYYGG